jgi:hypothetical protein
MVNPDTDAIFLLGRHYQMVALRKEQQQLYHHHRQLLIRQCKLRQFFKHSPVHLP